VSLAGFRVDCSCRGLWHNLFNKRNFSLNFPIDVFQLSGPAGPASAAVLHPYPALGALQGSASALRRHALRGTAPASPASEAQGHSRGLHPARGDERARGASRQHQGPRSLLEAHSWLGTIRPTSANDVFDPALWETFVSTTLGLEVPILAALPRLHNSPLAKCGCKKFSAWIFTATTQSRAQLTQVQQRRMIGW